MKTVKMMKLNKIILGIILIAFFTPERIRATEPPFLKYLNDPWVDTQLKNMSLEEKIAQLMMITAYPEQNDASKMNTLEDIKNYKPGGVLVMQGTPVKTTTWINEFQKSSKIPLLIAIDGEWGLSMRIDSTLEYPCAQAVGATENSNYVYEMGRDFGQQMKIMGINMNFAPDADINTNPENPVINFRSFGENKINVADKAWQVAKGMQDAGIIPVAKHFPGHGDTQTDSHKTLPMLSHSKERMDSIETYPFRFLAKNGISGIMTAHLNVPSLDKSETPSSLSSEIVNNYLKNEIGFKGFVVTDAINMQGVITKEGNAELRALKAGNDMVEFVPDIKKAVESVKQAVEKGDFTIAEIDAKCRKILALKRWVNLNEYKPADTKNLTARLNSPYYEVTNRKLVKESLTVLNNVKNILPVEHLDSFKIASVVVGATKITSFQKMLENYTEMDHFVLGKNATEREWANLRMKLGNYNLVILGIEGINVYPSEKYGITEMQQKVVSGIVQEKTTVSVFFGNAYALKYFENIHHSSGLILTYQNNNLTQELAAQLIFGAIDAKGHLPVSVDKRFKLHDGIQLKKNDCLSYSIPEEVGVNSEILQHKIDSIANLGLDKQAYPGCQVLVAKDGNIIFHKCYGFQTYEDEVPVRKDNLYDWASLTKVTAPLPALMRLVDENKFNVDDKFSKYWPDFLNSNKKDIKIRDILAHQARLESYITMWTLALDSNKNLDNRVFKDTPSEEFSVRVAPNLYMNHNFRATMNDTIRNSKLLPQKKYVYSGLTFLLYPDIISNLTGQPYEDYLKSTFYHPLGAYTITFNPYKHFPLERMIPTERDDFFRMEVVRGFVHDENAAMMGGVSGNAGLFGTANDLAKLFQMYLQKGYFGGKRYISEKTVNEFIRIQYPEYNNRRGLGFDKPLIDNSKNKLADAYPAVSSSKNSFGHSGFTGTFAWADPDAGVLYIFFSNRVYPTRENQKLYDLNIRTAIHQAIYDSILKK